VAKYLNHRAFKQAVFFFLGMPIVLLGGESPVISASTLTPQISQVSNSSGEQVPQQTPFFVGEVEQQPVRMDYLRQSNKGQTITYPGASFIKVHFSTLDLVSGDYVTVSDPTGTEKYTYPGSDSTTDGEPGFWSMSITGDTVVVQLHSRLSSRQLSDSSLSKSGFVIDKYGRGYPQAEIERVLPMSTCGASQRQDVACYQETNPTEFDKSNAVARLLIYYPDGYYAFCTAWRVGVGPNMLTNQHCLDSQTAVAASEAWFNYQNQTCNVSSIEHVTKVTGNSLLTSDLALDFSLFTVNSAESISSFGYLEIDPRTPEAGEQIYIPQHGGGNPKQLGIESDSNEGNVCRIDVPIMDGLDNGTDTGYYCDTTGGSSGSPVLSSSSNKVIAIHHFGSSSPPACTTPNQGVRMDLIWPLVEQYLLQVAPFGSIDNNNPTYTWKEMPSATWYYLWVDGPGGNLLQQWYRSADICSAGTCSVSPNVTLSGTAHQWWLQTWSPAGYGPWSSGMTFSPPAPVLPEKAVLVSPTGNIRTKTPTYIWNQVSSATWYYLWVDGPSGNVIQQWYRSSEANCNGSTCSITPSTILSAGAHSWWIQTYNSAGYGPWSDRMDFSVSPPGKATLVSPSGNITNNGPTYTWNEVSGSTWYFLWVDEPSGNVIQQWYTSAQANCDGTTCSVTPSTPLSNGGHSWWIQTYSSAGYGPWSDRVDFSVSVPPLPEKATLIAPSGDSGTNTPTYTWSEVPGVTLYRLWVNDSSGNLINTWYTAEVANCDGTNCWVAPAYFLSAGAHTWWIQTYNDAGYGPWSDSMTFNILSPPLPGKATLVSPSGSIGSNLPTYTWNEVYGSTWYYLWVDGPTGNVIQQWYRAAEANCNGITCSVTPSTSLGSGAHTWWIQTYNSTGYGPWSNRMDLSVP
jgi:hypothetical protein